MRTLTTLAAITSLCWSLSAAHAQDIDMGHCTEDSSVQPEDIVSACTGFISRRYAENYGVNMVPSAMVHQAVAYERMGQDGKAEAILKGVVTHFPKIPAGWEALGELLEKQKGPGMLMSVVDAMIKANTGDAGMLNAACWIRAKHGEQLDAALADCNQSLQIRPADAQTLDSRAFVYFRKGNFREAIADANAVLAADPKFASSLYVRGLAKLKSGDASGGNADIAAAKAIDAKIAEAFARYGVGP
jgi:tetratricopeptide (TPR) repeat protein